jgi:hypothetical protein
MSRPAFRQESKIRNRYVRLPGGAHGILVKVRDGDQAPSVGYTITVTREDRKRVRHLVTAVLQVADDTWLTAYDDRGTWSLTEMKAAVARARTIR